MRFTLREPLVLGHEVVGRVHNDPSGELAAGTPVAIHPATPCGHCPECLANARNVCRNARYFGSAASFPHTQGGFSEYMVVRQDQLRVLPQTLPLSRAVLAEPLAVGLHALNRAGGVAGAKVLVSGSGPIGVLAAGAAKATGRPRGLGHRPAESSRCRSPWTSVSTAPCESAPTPCPTSTSTWRSRPPGPRAAVGATLAAVRRRGVMVQLGMFAPGPRPAELSALVAKEIDYRGAFRFDTEFDDSIALLAGSTAMDPVITHTFDMLDAVAAMDAATDPAISGKVVLRLSEN